MTQTESTLAIVTGAGSGLGRALALEFLERGCHVAGLGRRAGPLEETGRLAGEGSRFTALPADIGARDEVERAFQAIEQIEAERIVLFNNAAIYERGDFVTDGSTNYAEHIRINVLGAVQCSYHAVQRMVRTGKGRIVNVGTFADLAPLPGSGGYAVSKGALRVFTRALVADLGKRFPDIVVNDWVPGALNTGMGLEDGLEPGVSAKWGVDLALRTDRTLNGKLFDMDREVLPPRSLKRKVAEALRLRPKRVPVVLAGS